MEFQENSNRDKHSVCCFKFISLSIEVDLVIILSFECNSLSPAKYDHIGIFYLAKIIQYRVPFILKISHYSLNSKHVSGRFEGNGSSGVLVLIPILSQQKLMNC